MTVPSAPPAPVAPARAEPDGRPELTLVVPTFCERENLVPFVAAARAALAGRRFEIIFVDDDSPDGTAAEAARLAAAGAPVRCLRRVGRRGLSSAVVEGAMAAAAEVVAVMDADLQHDERLLPRMLEIIEADAADVVVGSRNVEGGGMGDFSAGRQRMSRLATRASRALIGDALSDPMSGFFMTRRSTFDAAVYDLAQQGYKILLDLLTSAPAPLRVAELPYVFRARQAGASKVDAMIVLEYAFLLIEKGSGGLVPARFALFAAVGAVGLLVHLLALRIALGVGLGFLPAQGLATLAAMSFNFLVNNQVTYRDERLRGARLASGYLIFCAVCAFGAAANISVADLAMHRLHSWPLAGVAGALMSAVFNFGVTTRFVWGRRRRPLRLRRPGFRRTAPR